MENQEEFQAIKKDLVMVVVVIALFTVILFGLDFLQSKNQIVTRSATKISAVLLK